MQDFHSVSNNYLRKHVLINLGNYKFLVNCQHISIVKIELIKTHKFQFRAET